MKIWMKYLLGIILGVAAAFILPFSSPQFSAGLNFATELFLRLNSYILFPLLFSSACISAFRLAESKIFLKTSFWTFFVIIVSSLILTFTGLIAILFIKLPRIPISIEKLSAVTVLDLGSIVKQIFPYSIFSAFCENFFLFPVFLFAVIFGIACSLDTTDSRPVITLIDSLSKIFYKIMTFFVEVFSIGILILSVSWTIQFRSILAQGIFTPLIFILLGCLLFISLIVYPMILYFICHDPRPYRVLYASLASLFTAFISGNSNAVIPLLIQHSKESLGEQRRITAFTIPLFSIFARGGSALVTVVSFVIIWRSYSSLNITLLDLIWLSTISLALSFILGNMPSGGAIFSITILCTMYSRGFETGYLLLRPATLILGSFAAAFDAVTAIFGSYFIAVKTKQIRLKELSSFI
ncbi:MAG: cation:dicarboxylase symporter family transporter [Treponema sp.]|nr:cation:dicarboxylase symporter family transporter [Treponema sp.]